MPICAMLRAPVPVRDRAVLRLGDDVLHGPGFRVGPAGGTNPIFATGATGRKLLGWNCTTFG